MSNSIFDNAAPAIPTETGQVFSGVKVRELEWEPYASDGSTHRAKTDLAHYVVWEICERGYLSTEDGRPGRRCDGGLSGAKAAAQSDYAARVLSAIDIPAPAGGEEAVAWDRRYPAVFHAGEKRWSVSDYQGRDGLTFGMMHENRPGEWYESDMAPEEALQFALAILNKPSVAALSAPDHHLRVEVERLRAERDAFAGDAAHGTNRAIDEKCRADAAEARLATAETRIAELEEALRDVPQQIEDAFNEGYGSYDTGCCAMTPFAEQWETSEARQICEAARSALASSNKPVEEGR